MRQLDLNCDIGEGLNNEAPLMPFLGAANIACGGHAGDPDQMRSVLLQCQEHRVAAGAHPSYPDRAHFGRNDLLASGDLMASDLHNIVAEQVYTLREIAAREGIFLHHVKPHGALYNRVAWDLEAAHYLCQGICAIDPGLALYGLAGSSLRTVAQSYQLRFVPEAFADRSYQDDGSLTPRSQARSLLDHADEVERQVNELLQGHVTALSGRKIQLEAQTVCLHGDGPQVLEFAKRIHKLLYRINPDTPPNTRQ